jgi:hypothetical protein
VEVARPHDAWLRSLDLEAEELGPLVPDAAELQTGLLGVADDEEHPEYAKKAQMDRVR